MEYKFSEMWDGRDEIILDILETIKKKAPNIPVSSALLLLDDSKSVLLKTTGIN